jgi:hypothetical protein
VKCILCESGHTDHPHRVGVEALCGDCKKPGTVVATDATDYDPVLEQSAKTSLEVSVYSPHGLTCRDCETLRLKAALPRRGACPACGKEKGDRGFAESFCSDACRSAWATKQARP